MFYVKIRKINVNHAQIIIVMTVMPYMLIMMLFVEHVVNIAKNVMLTIHIVMQINVQ